MKNKKKERKQYYHEVPDNKMMLCIEIEIANKCQTNKILAGISIFFTYSFKINN